MTKESNTNVLKDIVARVASVAHGEYIAPNRAPDPNDRVIGRCTLHLMALYTAKMVIVKEAKPLIKEYDSLIDAVNLVALHAGSFTALIGAIDEEMRAKADQIKRLNAQLQPLQHRARLINRLIEAEINRLYPDETSDVVAIDSSWQLVAEKPKHVELDEMLAVLSGKGGKTRPAQRFDA